MADGYLVDDDVIKKIAELVKSGDKELADNIKALQYIIDNSNRLTYTGQVVTNSNSAVGDIKNVIINGNTRYKKTDGTYIDTWESGISLESIGEAEKNSDGKYPVEVASYNSNVINKCCLEIGDLDLVYGGLGTDTSTYRTKDFIEVVNSKIVIRGLVDNTTLRVFYYSNTKTYLGSKARINGTYDLAASVKFVKVHIPITNLTNNFLVYWNTDLKEDKRTILLDNPLRKVGEVADVLDLNNSQVIRKCGSVILDGSSDEIWTINTIKTDVILFDSKNIIREKCVTQYHNINSISDKFPSVEYDIMWNSNNEEVSIRDDAIIINISKTKIETPDGEGLKKWLASNPITVVYQLATPTTERIEILPTDNPLQSYNNSTTLTLNNIINGNISADIPTNVNAIIVNQASEIAKLQNSLLETQSTLIETQYNSLT